jgi:hypothetical protein
MILSFFYLFDSIDEAEVFEIDHNEREGEDEDELALTSSSRRIGPPSTPSPVKTSFVLFQFFFSILSVILLVEKNMLFPLPTGMRR